MRHWQWIAVVCCWGSLCDAGEVGYEQSDFWNACAPCGNLDGCCELNCDSCVCYECCPPCWELSVGLLVMARENKDVPVALDPDFVGPVLSGNDFNGEYDLGFELMARHCRWELRYLQFTNESATTYPGAGSYLNIPFAGPATFVYDTNLHSGEANYLLTPIENPLQVTTGVRNLRLNDTIDFNAPAPLRSTSSRQRTT